MPNRVRTARQRKSWDSFGLTQHIIVGNGTFASGTTLTVVAGTMPFTVLRMLGEYVIGPTVAPTVSDFCNIGVGIAKVSVDAISLGATALPDPIGDMDYPWLYNAQHPLAFANVSTDPSSPTAAIRHRFDIGTMRVVNPAEGLAFVVQYSDGAGSPAVTLTVGEIRVLQGR